ncbi:MAG: RluA family pseudouridine synthase [Rickettsiales bacterium]|nr:MAG: RluA family pseudouridine synthase [Rickettsiales bacterium]
MIKLNDKFVGVRLDKALSEDSSLSRVVVQSLIQGNNVKKNGIIFTDNSYKIRVGDVIEYEIISEVSELKAKAMELEIVYEDNDLIVINKPAGLTTHPNGHNDTNTLVNVLLTNYKDKLSTIGGDFRPGIVHRLDKDTSGLMVIAKNDATHLNLKEQLELRLLSRRYIGIVWGAFLHKEGEIEGYITRNALKMKYNDTDNGGRYSLTKYKTLHTYLNNSLSMIEFELNTGRTHQIRLHCSAKKHPIVGDSMYGGKTYHLKNEYVEEREFIENFPRQALHSYKISFKQPTTGKVLKFEIGMPDDIKKLIEIIK